MPKRIRWPAICWGDFSRNCRSLEIHLGRMVRAAGVQWGNLGFMFYRVVPIADRTHIEPGAHDDPGNVRYLRRVSREELVYWIVGVLAGASFVTGIVCAFLELFWQAAFLILITNLLVLIARFFWSTQRQIIINLVSMTDQDRIEVVHSASYPDIESGVSTRQGEL